MKSVERDLEEAMEHEASIIRELLPNLTQEQIAIVEGNQQILDHLMEERLVLLEAFDKWSKRLILAIQEMCHVEGSTLNHEEALDYLEKYLEAVKNYDLLISRQMLMTLLGEAKSQCAINTNLRQKGAEHHRHAQKYQVNALNLPLTQGQSKRAKVEMQVLEPDEES